MNSVLRVLIISVVVFGITQGKAVFPATAGQQSRLAYADGLFMKRSDKTKAAAALNIYRDVLKSNPGDAEAAWRVSMACYFVGFEVSKDNSEKKKMFAEGRDAGIASLALNAGSAQANFWTGVNMALYGQTTGVVKMLFTVPGVRGYLIRSAAIDPSYAYGGAYRILGKIDQELPGILGGSNKAAKDYYEKAINAAPDEPLNYLFMADLVLKTDRDRLKALDFAYKGLALPEPDESRHESKWALTKLKEFVKVNSYTK